MLEIIKMHQSKTKPKNQPPPRGQYVLITKLFAILKTPYTRDLKLALLHYGQCKIWGPMRWRCIWLLFKRGNCCINYNHPSLKPNIDTIWIPLNWTLSSSYIQLVAYCSKKISEMHYCQNSLLYMPRQNIIFPSQMI